MQYIVHRAQRPRLRQHNSGGDANYIWSSEFRWHKQRSARAVSSLAPTLRTCYFSGRRKIIVLCKNVFFIFNENSKRKYIYALKYTAMYIIHANERRTCLTQNRRINVAPGMGSNFVRKWMKCFKLKYHGAVVVRVCCGGIWRQCARALFIYGIIIITIILMKLYCVERTQL